MARKDATPAVEEEILQKKPHHPEATIMLILSAVILIGAISFTSSDLFGRYLTQPEDAQALDAEMSPADVALERVMKQDPAMGDIIKALEGDS